MPLQGGLAYAHRVGHCPGHVDQGVQHLPIIDAFRQVSDGLLLGAMDAKQGAADGTYYFYITKIKEA